MLLDRSGFYAATSCSDKSLALYDFDIGECVAGMVGHSGELRLGGSSFIMLWPLQDIIILQDTMFRDICFRILQDIMFLGS